MLYLKKATVLFALASMLFAWGQDCIPADQLTGAFPSPSEGNFATTETQISIRVGDEIRTAMATLTSIGSINLLAQNDVQHGVAWMLELRFEDGDSVILHADASLETADGLDLSFIATVIRGRGDFTNATGMIWFTGILNTTSATDWLHITRSNGRLCGVGEYFTRVLKTPTRTTRAQPSGGPRR